MKLQLVLLAAAVTGLAQAQTNPTSFNLAASDFTFSGFALGTDTVYPSSMQGWTITAGTPRTEQTLNAAPTADLALGANSVAVATGGIRNEIGNGISMLSSGSAAPAVAIGLNTTNRQNVTVSWYGAQVNDVTTKQCGVRLQYRVGTSGNFSDAAPISDYKSLLSGTDSTGQQITTVTLPVSCNNQPTVQVRFVHYDVLGGSGSRDRIRVDEILISSSAYVAPTSFFNNGAVDGSVTVGSGGNFASLEACAADFNAVSGGINANWAINIISDLTETYSSAFGNTVNGGKVVKIVPSGGARKITFAQTGVSGLSGFGAIQSGTGATWNLCTGLVIGANTLSNSATSAVTMPGFEVGDPSGPVLTLENTPAMAGSSAVLVVTNDNDSVKLRNLAVNNVSTNTTFESNSAIDLLSNIPTGGAATGLHPDSATIDSCTVVGTASPYGKGIKQDRGPVAAAAGNGPQINTTISNNTVTAARYGIELDMDGGTSPTHTKVRSNHIKIVEAASGIHSIGVIHTNVSASSNWTIEISGNNIDQLETANTASGTAAVPFGLSGISCNSGGGTGGVYQVFNNMISGFKYNGTVSVDNVAYRGIAFTSAVVNPSINVYHNSIYMPAQANYTFATPEATQVFGVGTLATVTGTDAIKNNIIAIGQTGGNAVKIVGGTVTVDYNDLYTAGSASQGTAGTNAQNIDPTVALVGRTGSWNVSAAPYNLHFNAAPGFQYAGTPIATVPTDIDGDTRSVSQPFMGADELITGLPVSISAFTID